MYLSYLVQRSPAFVGTRDWFRGTVFPLMGAGQGVGMVSGSFKRIALTVLL